MREPRSAGNLWGSACKVVFAVLILSSTIFASTYDLESSWGPNNPNGPWAFLQGATLLYQSACNFFAPNCPPTDPYLPVWSQVLLNATPNLPYYEPGDVWTHSVDGFNGNPGLGESMLRWTAPFTGTISITGDIWYLHGTCCTDRSNDFFLYLNNTLLTSGTVSGSGPNLHDRTNPIVFSFAGDLVKAGDTLTLVVERSAGQSAGVRRRRESDNYGNAGIDCPRTQQPPSPPDGDHCRAGRCAPEITELA
jgi:hypothetical protein